MSRKHYIQFARVFREQNADEVLVRAFAEVLKSDNPRFDAEQFLRAAGIE